MPPVDRYSQPTLAFDQWVLLFRDYCLEHSVGFLGKVVARHPGNRQGFSVRNLSD
ncbi:hypothetical protein [Streptomyces ehimensis]|uniref:Uncharacterized protein n=1 Tax=Streptomyces ehimensis TaxID=68195 RepID=A0ABV9BW10_9ACTN